MAVRAGIRRRQGGFTLLEILIAVTILAIAVVAGLKAIEANTNNVFYLKQRTMATWVGLNQIAELQLENLSTKWPAAAAAAEGEVEMAGVEWKWKSVGKKVESLASDDFYELTVTVALAEAPDQVLSSHTTFLAKRR